MNNNSINLEDLDNDYIISEIGKGVTSTCYLTKDGNVFKKFNGNIDYNMLYLNNLIDYTNPYITFPKKLVYSKNELIGYIKEYAKGIEIDNLDKSINLKDFIKSIKIFEDNIYELFFKLLFTDLSCENIVYDSIDKKVSIIDVDFFEPKFNNHGVHNYNFIRMNVFLENKKWINQAFYSIISKCNNIDAKLDDIIMEGSVGLTSTSFELQQILNKLEQLSNKSIITYGDFEEAIKEIKENNYGKNLIRYRRYNN